MPSPRKARPAVAARVAADEATLNVRPLPADAARRIKQAARSRGWTVGAYLAALVQLHEEIRTRADFGDDGAPSTAGFAALDVLLQRLGLQTVRS